MSRDGSGRPTSWAHRRAHCDGVALRTDHASQGAMLQLATCEGELCGQPHSYLSNIDSAVPGRRAEQAANSPGVSGPVCRVCPVDNRLRRPSVCSGQGGGPLAARSRDR
jgi:hypothetical protein